MAISYQVLARKWRPQTFKEMVGQQHVVVALRNALASGRLHHAYLFSGTRGVGKTSIARLLAKGLNCETGITEQPCGVCSHCQQIEQGRFVDLIEIDAASRTKVEDIRDILDNVQYMPSQGRFKVYLIDEVHMLSRSSFNALLKTLEEPPAHVKFLFATTDAQKLPITILSRCLHFHLRPLNEAQIQQQLNAILSSESIVFQERATALLARAANGSMRDGLSLADQATALGGGEIEYDTVLDMLGLPDRLLAIKLVDALINGNSLALFGLLNDLAGRGGDWDLLVVEVLLLLHQIGMLQLSPDYPIADTEQRHLLNHLVKRVSPVDLQLYYQIISQGRAELDYAPNRMMGVEMLFLRALAFHPITIQQTELSETKPAIEPVMPSQNLDDKLLSSARQTAKLVTPSETQRTARVATPVNSAISNEDEAFSNPNRERTLPEIVDKPDAITNKTKQLLQARNKIKQQGEETPNIKKSETRQRVAPIKDERPRGGAKLVDSTPITLNQSNNSTEYRWQNSEGVPQPDSDCSVNQLKEQVEQRSPELIEKIRQEALASDQWAQQIEKLTLAPLVQQILLNSSCRIEQEGQLHIYVRASHWQLTTENNRQVIGEAFRKLENKALEIHWHEALNAEQPTPMEWRETIYQQKLVQAQHTIQQDALIKLICDKFDAEIDEQSIQPI